nr:alcohol dehydrogenase catalytic domain-containing protein [Mesorhizobium sp. WSM3864]
MAVVVLVGHGGFEKLEYRTDLASPKPAPGEALIRVAAAGVNNADINTRIGWYSKGVTTGTQDGAISGFQSSQDADASWSGAALASPRIQGADRCGRIVAVGEGVHSRRRGERLVVRHMLRSYVDYRPWEC